MSRGGATARGAMEMDRYVRIIEGEEVRRDEPIIGAEFVILPGMRKLYDVKIKTLPFDCL